MVVLGKSSSRISISNGVYGWIGNFPTSNPGFSLLGFAPRPPVTRCILSASAFAEQPRVRLMTFSYGDFLLFDISSEN